MDAGVDEASFSAAHSSASDQSGDFTAAASDLDPFGAAAEVSERDPSAQVSTFAAAPAHPFGAPAELPVEPGPVADDAALAGPEDPFAGQGPSSRTDATALADGELNGSAEARPEAEARPRTGRWWPTFRGRS